MSQKEESNWWENYSKEVLVALSAVVTALGLDEASLGIDYLEHKIKHIQISRMAADFFWYFTI